MVSIRDTTSTSSQMWQVKWVQRLSDIPGGKVTPDSIQLLQCKLGRQTHTLAITDLKTKQTDELHKRLVTVYNFFTFKYTVPLLWTRRPEGPIKDNWSHNQCLNVDTLRLAQQGTGRVGSRVTQLFQLFTFHGSSHTGSKRHCFGVCAFQHPSELITCKMFSRQASFSVQ